MWSKNKARMTRSEAAHVEKVKESSCAVCDAPPPCDAHEIRQGDWFTSISLCRECHLGKGGIHGDKTMWRIAKLDEIGALNITLSRIYG